MRILFMGSGGFALPSLEALLRSDHDVTGLVTQPDKPAGRGHRLRMPKTKEIAIEHELEVRQPEKLRAEDSVRWIRENAPELVVVVAYGQIVPKSVLAIPPRGIINVHGSLLPAYRGAAPIQWAIANGEARTGVTTMLMDEGLDTGPALLAAEVDIARDDTAESLGERLAAVGAELLMDTIAGWERGDIEPRPQDDDAASSAPRIRKEDARVDWSWSAREIDNRTRAFVPWPVAFATMGGEPVRIWRARAIEEASGARSGDANASSPGTVLRIDEKAVLVACGGGSVLRLEELQPPGRPRMPAAAFARGRRLAPGSSL